jgi:hypothetical protein
MKIVTHEHGPAQRIIPNHVKQSLTEHLEGLDFTFTHRCAADLRHRIMDGLRLLGWSGTVRVAHESGITITSMHGDIGLCLQTGNVCRFYADLLKLQYLWQKGKARAAFFLIPTQRRALQMGSNVAYFERFVEELSLFRDIITIPMLVVGLD